MKKFLPDLNLGPNSSGLIITPIELKNVSEFGINNWKSLSDLGKSNVESKPIPISRKAL